jgi:hypothetical protein
MGSCNLFNTVQYVPNMTRSRRSNDVTLHSKQLILVLFTTFHLIIIVETVSQITDHDT